MSFKQLFDGILKKIAFTTSKQRVLARYDKTLKKLAKLERKERK